MNFNINKNENKRTLQYENPEKLIMKNFTPTIVANVNRHNINNNQLFTKIISGFNNNNFLFHNNYKKNLFFNNFKNKNIDISNESNNIKHTIENEIKSNFEAYNINSNKNKLKTLKKNKSPDKITLNSLHQIQILNLKPSNKEPQNLYYNNINININNYNIKKGKNKINDNFINYLNTDNQINNKFNKNNSITNWHNPKKIYFKAEINKVIQKTKTINNDNELSLKYNYINKTDENKDIEIEMPSKTQENIYKPNRKRHFNFDITSFHSSYNNKGVANKNNKI